MDLRQQALQIWLEKHLPPFKLEAMTGDASFRRYFRVSYLDKTFVAMDAPPERESCVSFIKIANVLREHGLHAPEIFLSDLDQGFLLLTDFGNKVLLQHLTNNNAEELYKIVLDVLVILQAGHNTETLHLPIFSDELMLQELQLFKEWFLVTHLKLELTPGIEKMLHTFFNVLVESAVQQPQVMMHRDFHSGNLMILPQNKIGILDFQDAFKGPVTYDVVSLLRDCYINWPQTFVNKLALYYKNKLSFLNATTDETYLRWFDLMGLQRHLKALLTFSRKFHRDANSNYLQHIPRTLNYILQVSERYPEAKEFLTFLKEETVGVSICEE